MNIIDIEKESDLDLLKAEVCIIGSGPAGGVLAVELAKKRIDVLLLEAGNLRVRTDYDSISRESSFQDYQRKRWSHQLGGSSNLWAGRIGEFQEIDFEKRTWVPESGWPITLEDIKPYYHRAKEIMGIPQGYLANPHVFSEIPSIEEKNFFWNRPPFNLLDYLVDASEHYTNLRICINAPVTKLKEGSSSPGVKEAVISRSQGKDISVKSEIYVVAAGGIETPRLLLNSNNIKTSGIGNEHDQVGRYLSTHPKGYLAMMSLDKPIPTDHELFKEIENDSGIYQNGLGFTKKQQQDFQLLNHYVDLLPIYKYRSNKLFDLLFRKTYFISPFIDKEKWEDGFLSGVYNLFLESGRRLLKRPAYADLFMLSGYLAQYPDRDNRVCLSNEEDRYGSKKAQVIWRFTDNDKTSVLRFFDVLHHTLIRQKIGKIDFARLSEMDEWPMTNIHSHLMGTTRMGEDIKTSVTDKNGQVHGSSNLFVAGSSLFPTYGHVNPFLTIMALSLRMSDHLVRFLKR